MTRPPENGRVAGRTDMGAGITSYPGGGGTRQNPHRVHDRVSLAVEAMSKLHLMLVVPTLTHTAYASLVAPGRCWRACAM